jgi:hypothetical protein
MAFYNAIGARLSPVESGENAMHRYAFIAAILIAMGPAVPAHAVSAKDQMATCKFGADDQKLQGAARNNFMKKCMANRNDPRGPGGASAGVPPPPKQ